MVFAKRFVGCLAVLFTACLAESILAGPVTPNLVFVATVDGKSFFAEKSPSRNWTAAGDYCTSMGMRLATISSRNQSAALKAAYSTDFSGVHWTSGRDSQLIRQFSWNETNQEVPSGYLELDPNPIEYQTCLAIDSRSANASVLRYYTCISSLATLCETV